MKKNIWAIIIITSLFVISRFPDLGHDVFNTDVWKWKQRSYDFGTGVFTGQFEKTIQKYHPGVTLMWIGSIGVKVYNLYNDLTFGSGPADDNVRTVFGLHFVQKFILVIVIGLGIGALFVLLRGLFGPPTATALVFLMCLEPFYIALTRVFHLEGLMSTLMILSAVSLYVYLSGNKKSYLVFSGVTAGLAYLTKTSALYLIPFTALVLLVFAEKRILRNIFRAFGLWLLTSVIVVFVLWPIMWVKPVEAISEMYRGISEIGVETDHAQIFFGKYVSDPGPLFYFIVLVLRVTPWLVVGLAGLPFIYNSLNSRKKRFILYLSVFAVFYFIQCTIPAKKLDRYILPSLLALSLMTSFAFIQLVEILRLPSQLKRVIPLLLILSVAYLHPDYFSYYNPMFGGLKTGINILEPKWMIGIKQINDYFVAVRGREGLQSAPDDQSYEEIIKNKTVEKVLTVAFPEKYYTQIWPFFRENKSWAVINDLAPFARTAKYYVYPVWDDTSANEDRFKIEPYGQVKLRGVTLYNVYKRANL